jgi:hypothetical protein
VLFAHQPELGVAAAEKNAADMDSSASHWNSDFSQGEKL